MGCGNPTIKRTIGVVEAFALLTAAVVAKGGDFFYQKDNASSLCSYRNAMNRDMRCIVGEGFFRKYGIEEIAQQGSIGTIDVQRFLYQKHDMILTEDAVMILQAAQRVQDQGKSWGDALAAAVNQHHGIEVTVDKRNFDFYKP